MVTFDSKCDIGGGGDVIVILVSAKLINASALVSGRIVVNTEDKDKRPHQLEIPFEANVLFG